MTKINILPLLLLTCLSLTRPTSGMQTDNHGIHAVPAPHAVVIDGKLDDWDLSGQTLICYDVQILKDLCSGRVAMMHDAENLYVSIHWKDPTPIGNSHDPQFQASRGWAGDSVQMRFKTDRISHLTAWCYAKKQEPFIDIAYGQSMTKPFDGGSKQLVRTEGWKMQEGAEMAFKADADGKGYVQEIKLPWSLITLNGRAALGEKFSCGLELLWGEADWPVHRYADNLAEGQTSREFFWTAHNAWGPVWLEKAGNLKLPEMPWEKAAASAERPEGPVKISYKLAKDQRVTLAIDDEQGHRVRNLLAAAERKAGANVDLWDGLNDKGELVPPGEYRVKGLSHDGLHVQYAGSFASPANPPWSTADGKGAFYGDHTAPEAAIFGPGKLGALACPMGEAGAHLIGVDLQGRRQWGLANRSAFGGGRISLATDGKTLWVANADGRSGAFTIWRCDLATGTYAPWKRTGSDGKAVLDLPVRDTNALAQCRTIAIKDGRLVVILAAEHKILVMDAESGDTTKELSDMPADMAAGTFRADGKLLLAAGRDVYLIDIDKGTRSVLATGLVDPQGVAEDKQGRIFVSQRGAAMNVTIFSASGKPLGSIGKPGGRPANGFFDPAGMLNPAQIAVDSLGRLWVPESDQQPKRTSVWTDDPSAGSTGSLQAGSGQVAKLAFDLIGTTAYSAGGSINPFDVTCGFSERVEYKLDLVNQTSRPVFTLPDALGTGSDWIARYARVGGREYIQLRSTARDAGMVKIYLRLPDGAWRHVAEWGNVGQGKSLDDKSCREWNRKYSTPLWEGLFGKAFLWVDQNDDGIAQREEIQVNDRPVGRFYWGQAMGDDLTVAEPVKGSNDILIFKPDGFTAGGSPRYSFARMTTLSPKGNVSGEGMMAVGREGRLYLDVSPLQALDPAGQVMWTYPSDYVGVHGSHRAPAPKPGLLIGPSSIYGTALVNSKVGEVFYMNGNLGQNFIFTEDGLWVQSLFQDTRGWNDVPGLAIVGMPCDAMTAGGESFGGWFCKSSNKKYYICGGGTAAIVFELTGLDSLKRFRSEIKVTPADLVAADALRLRRAARTQQARICTAKARVTPPPLDGTLAGWEMDKGGVEVAGGAGVVGSAKLAYDAQNLYVAWKVNDPSPLKNAGQDDRLMFITGDGVDLMLRTTAAKDEKPVAGDFRLLLTVKAGKPMAVLYQPVAPGTPKAEAAELSSPWRSVHFDRVRTLEIPLAMKVIPGGYAVTAAVPLKLLGLETLKGKTLRGDFGILLSDSAGQECTSRNYWSNKQANNTSDVPDEAQLAPGLWGEVTFE